MRKLIATLLISTSLSVMAGASFASTSSPPICPDPTMCRYGGGDTCFCIEDPTIGRLG